MGGPLPSLYLYSLLMLDAFDPYVQWLGISDPQRPPNHYRLLGVEPFTSDLNVLAQAADRRLAMVAGYRAGPCALWAERLVAELAAARACLLQPASKADYDRWLRQAIGDNRPLTPPPLRVSGPPVPPPTIRPAAVRPAADGQTGSWAVALLTAVLLVLIGAIAFLLAHRRSTPESVPADPAELLAAQPSDSPAVREIQPEPVVKAEEQPVPRIERSETRRAPMPASAPVPFPTPSAERPPAAQSTTPPEVKPRVTPSSPPEAKPAEKPEPMVAATPRPGAKPGPNTEPKRASSPDVKPEAKPSLTPVPDEAAVRKAAAEVQTTYRDGLQASEPEARLELTRRLVVQALGEQSDKAMQYALFSQALDVAVDLGAVKIFAQVIQLVTDRYAVDGLQLKVDKLCQNARRARPAEAHQSLAKVALDVAAEAMAAERYEQAVRLGEAAREMARRAKDTARLKQAAALLRDTIARQEAQASDAKARETLVSRPDDPRANLVRGKYLCFVRGDWSAGLAHLQQGSDPVLRRLAEAERYPPVKAAQMSTLADQWWDAVRLLDEGTQRQAQDRAVWWYQRALPDLTGAAKSRAKKRVDEAAEDRAAAR